PGTGSPLTINVGVTGSGALPTILKPLTIDGYTEPGASANTQTTSDNARILIELNGTAAGATANGLTLGVGSGGSTIRGLVINRFGGNGILVQTSGNVIAGNFIGTNTAGTALASNGADGVRIQS